MAEPQIWLAAAQDGTLLCPFAPPVEESIFTQTASTRGYKEILPRTESLVLFLPYGINT